MKKYLKWIVCVLFLLIFGFLSVLVVNGKDIYIDTLVYKFLSSFINDNLTSVIKWMTYIGSAVAVISITVFTLIFYKNKRYGLFMAIDLIAVTILQVTLKHIFLRSRPMGIALIKETGYSFPSGHSITSMAFYGFIIYLIFISKLDRRKKTIFIILFSLLICVTGISRIYLGVHYFTDVIGGFTLGISYLIIYTSIIRKRIA